MTIQLRLAARKDLDALMQIEHAAFSPELYDQLSRRQYRYLLLKANAEICIAEQDNQVIAVCIILYRQGTKVGRIYSLAVHPNAQKQGVGNQLLQFCYQKIKAKNRTSVLCEVRKDQSRLLKFYHTQGFELIHELKSYYPDGCAGLKLKKVITV